jgi:hypothetical protein
MFKRGFWLTTGLSAGAVGALYLEKKAKEKLKSATPPAIVKKVTSNTKGLKQDIEDAIVAGKLQARKTRHELTDKLYKPK